MQVDVTELRDFYRSPLGQICALELSRQLRELWPAPVGATLIGLGFPTPFLAQFMGEALRIGAFMPGPQGVLIWPDKPPHRSVLADPEMLPLPSMIADFVLVAHALEMSGNPNGLLREVARILHPGGRAVFMVANRLSPWASIDSTPFGHGRPYSRGQLARLLREAGFEPCKWRHALFFPPYRRLLRLQRYFPHFERLGRRFWPGISGVFIVEASKCVYAAQPKNGLRVRVPDLGPILLPEPSRPISSPAPPRKSAR